MKTLIITMIGFLSLMILISKSRVKQEFYKNGTLIAFIDKSGQIAYKKGFCTQIIDTNGDDKPDYTNTTICSKFGYVSTNLPVSKQDKVLFKKFIKNTLKKSNLKVHLKN